MLIIATSIFFTLGTLIGSFINMAIYRTHSRVSFFTKRSFCDYCKKSLKVQDLIPIVSYIYYKGKSRCCGKKLDAFMPIVEIVTGISFALVFLFITGLTIEQFNNLAMWNQNFVSSIWIINIIYSLIITTTLIYTFFYDLKYFEIPLVPILGGYIIWAFKQFANIYFYRQHIIETTGQTVIGEYLLKTNWVNDAVQYFINNNIMLSLYFALSVFIFFLILFLVTKGRGMGFGDVYTAPLLALLAGFPGAVVYLFSSFLFGAFYGIFTIFTGKNTVKSRIPFGPFLIIGLVFSLFLGETVVKFYLGLMV